MSRAFAFTLHRPHEVFQLPVPMHRRLGALTINHRLWTGLLLVSAMACAAFLVFLVNAGASKSFTLRRLEAQRTSLREGTSALEDQYIRLQAMNQIQTRVEALGYVPVTHYEFIDIGSSAYALAR